jgi:hypothetical protein
MNINNLKSFITGKIDSIKNVVLNKFGVSGEPLFVGGSWEVFVEKIHEIVDDYVENSHRRFLESLVTNEVEFKIGELDLPTENRINDLIDEAMTEKIDEAIDKAISDEGNEHLRTVITEIVEENAVTEEYISDIVRTQLSDQGDDFEDSVMSVVKTNSDFELCVLDIIKDNPRAVLKALLEGLNNE